MACFALGLHTNARFARRPALEADTYELCFHHAARPVPPDGQGPRSENVSSRRVAAIQVRTAVGFARVIGDPHQNVRRRREPRGHERRKRPEQIELPGRVVRAPRPGRCVRDTLGRGAGITAAAVEEVGLRVEVDGLRVDRANARGSTIRSLRDEPSTEDRLPVVHGQAVSRQLDAAASGRMKDGGLAVIARRQLADREHERQAKADDKNQAGHEQHRDQRDASIVPRMTRAHWPTATLKRTARSRTHRGAS